MAAFDFDGKQVALMKYKDRDEPEEIRGQPKSSACTICIRLRP